MTPFQEFRLWTRRAPTAERMSAGFAAAVAIALLGYVVVPSGDAGAGTDSGPALTTTGNGAPAPAGQSGQSGGVTAATSAGTGLSAPGGAQPVPAGGAPAAVTGGANATSAGSGAGGTAGCTSARASGPGITTGQIKVAVTLAEIVGPAGNQTFGIPPVSSQEAKYDAVVKDVNAHGGLACRHLVLQYYKVNPADQSDMHQKCLDIVQAGDFAVLDDGGEALAPDCFGQNKIAYISSNLLFARSASHYYPYLMTPYGLYDDAYRNMVSGLKARGFFDRSRGFNRLGLLYFDCVPDLISEMTGWLHQAGLPDSAIVTYDAGCPSPPVANPSDLEQAILKFRSSGVTHVTFADFMGSEGTFTSAAQRQNFHPRYGIADDGYIGVSQGTGKPDGNNFDGAVAITGMRFGEEHTPGVTPTSATAKCNAILHAGGLPPVYQEPYASNGGFVCDMVWMLQAAVQHASALTRTSIASGLAAAHSIDFSYPVGPDDFGATHGVAGGQDWRAISYGGACGCWRLADAAFHPGAR